MIKAIPLAVEVWGNPQDMVGQWKQSASKQAIETMLGAWVGPVRTVADLGCGAGRLVPVLACARYRGFDQSDAMLKIAIEQYGNKAPVTFHKQDVFKHGGKGYDVVILYDVAQHQNEPIEAIRRVLKLWDAKRYIFSLLVGTMREELALSTVVSMARMSKFLDGLNVTRFVSKRTNGESFWGCYVETKKG